MTRHRHGGQAVTEYVALVAVVLAFVAVLTALVPYQTRRVPINPLTRIGALVAPPPRVVAPKPRVVRRTAPRAPRRRTRRAVVLVPAWSVG